MLRRRWRFHIIAATEAVVWKHHLLRVMKAYLEMVLQSPRKPLLHQENICILQLDVGVFLVCLFTVPDLFQPVATAVSEWWNFAKSKQHWILFYRKKCWGEWVLSKEPWILFPLLTEFTILLVKVNSKMQTLISHLHEPCAGNVWGLIG